MSLHITLDPAMGVEPGYQVIILPTTIEGHALAQLLTGKDSVYPLLELSPDDVGLELRIPHTADVDERIVELINTLSHIRFSAPGLVQLEMAG